jgi:hypothetical protein
VAGSLRSTPEGFSLAAQNPMGQGTLIGLGRLAVDGQAIPLADLSAVRASDGAVFDAAAVDRAHPISVGQGDRVTLQVRGVHLEPGDHRLELELDELNLGRLRLSLTDRLAAT